MLKLFSGLYKRLNAQLSSTFKTLFVSQPKLPFDINRQVLFWLPFVLMSIMGIFFFIVLRNIDLQEKHIYESSEASIALGDLSTKVSEAVMQSTAYLLNPNFDASEVYVPSTAIIEEAQEQLSAKLVLHEQTEKLQEKINEAIKLDLDFVTALVNNDTAAINQLQSAKASGPTLQESFTLLGSAIQIDREEHLSLLKLYQRSLNYIFIAGFFFALFSILYGLRLSGNDLSTGFNRLSQDISRLRRGELLSISNKPSTEMSQLDVQLLETSQHLQEQNKALAAKTQELELQENFRKGLSEFVSESLQHGIQTNFYQKLLDRAVEVIPDSQAGSLLLLKPDERYHYEAVVNYQLESMPVLSFDAEEIALHYSDNEPSRFQDFSINQDFEDLDVATSEAGTKVFIDSSGGRHQAVLDSLAIPVRVEGVTQAYLTLDNFERADVFGNEAVSMAEIFAAQVGTVMTRLKLQENLHQRQIEIQQRNEELARADRLKSEFLANMSHELRTPLTAILGFAELLKEELFGQLNPKQDQYVGDIYKSGDHLLSLINDILDLSKIEAGHMDLNRDRHNITELVDSVIGIMKERARKANITIETNIPNGLDALFVDGRKVKQVLFNLISNAVKFTPDRGRVDIKVIEREDRIEVQVIDTGIGISPEDQKKLFQEFSQLDSSLTKAHEGTGLGLALSKRFVELHGGEIWVESTLEKGSAFIFSLPFGTSQVQLHKEFEDFANRNLRPGIVIVAEAQTVQAEVQALKENDYRVLVTSEASTLVEQLSRPKRVDLIIIDEAIHEQSNLVKEISELLKVTQQRSPILLMAANVPVDKVASDKAVSEKVVEVENLPSLRLGHGIDAILDQPLDQPFDKTSFLTQVSTLIYRDVKPAKVALVGNSDVAEEDSALKDLVHTLGHQFMAYADGETALENIITDQPDLLICHFALEDMSAGDLLEILEEMDYSFNSMTVVMLIDDDSLKEFFDDSIYFDDAKTISTGATEKLQRYLWNRLK